VAFIFESIGRKSAILDQLCQPPDSEDRRLSATPVRAPLTEFAAQREPLQALDLTDRLAARRRQSPVTCSTFERRTGLAVMCTRGNRIVCAVWATVRDGWGMAPPDMR
jgi:hypothetical protein